MERMTMVADGSFRAAVLLAAAAVAAAGCAQSIQVQEYEYTRSVPEVRAVVLLAPDTSFRGMASYQVYEKWMDLAHALESRFGVVVVGADEMRFTSASSVTDLARETNLAELLRRYGVLADNAIAVRLNLTESWQEVFRLVTQKEQARSSLREFDSELQLTLDVYHVGTSKPVLSVSNRFEGVLWDEPDEVDARPEVTRFVREAERRLLEELQARFVFSRLAPEAMSVQVWENPAECMKYKYQALPSAEESMAQVDAIEVDAFRRGRIVYRYPDLDRGGIRGLMGRPAGVLVGAGSACCPLQAGDFVVSADGRPVTREYQLRREIGAAVAPGAAVSLGVVRGEAQEVQVSCACGSGARTGE